MIYSDDYDGADFICFCFTVHECRKLWDDRRSIICVSRVSSLESNAILHDKTIILLNTNREEETLAKQTRMRSNYQQCWNLKALLNIKNTNKTIIKLSYYTMAIHHGLF